MKIACIGYGNMARALAARWTAEHEVFIGGRNPDRAGELAEEVRAAGSGTTARAVEFGSIIDYLCDQRA